MLSVDGNILSFSMSYRTSKTKPVYFGLIAKGNGIETSALTKWEAATAAIRIAHGTG
jgi:hypothetical protein